MQPQLFLVTVAMLCRTWGKNVVKNQAEPAGSDPPSIEQHRQHSQVQQFVWCLGQDSRLDEFPASGCSMLS